MVMTVRGPVPPAGLGVALPHEHLFSNFGEAPAEPGVYNEAALLAAVIPSVAKARERGCGTIADATAAWFGRNPRLLRIIAGKTGLSILTNTGYYGAAQDRYVPELAYVESEEALAARWVQEYRAGIGQTGIRPGFLKIGVDGVGLSPIDAKLVRAAARAHRQTGLAIQVHTGNNVEGAMRQLAILKQERVRPEAWIWVHANQVKDEAALKEAAQAGAWISLDGLDAGTMERHLELAVLMKQWGRLGQVLLSHDGNSFRAGGKRPARDYTLLFDVFVPRLASAGFSQEEIRHITVGNPARALAVKRRLA